MAVKLDYSADEINEAVAKMLSYEAPYLGKLTVDPATGGWGMAEEGSWWYNLTDHHFKGWNGTEIVLLG
jgi:hypothetical protein